MNADEARALIDAYPTVPGRDQVRDALETVISLTALRPPGGKAMTAAEARGHLERLKPHIKCFLCGAINPANVKDGVHVDCPGVSGTALPMFTLPSYEMAEEALTSVIHLFTALRHALPYCYDPADQTVACPECGEVWWDQDTDLDGNWHAPGCRLFQARVLVGDAKDVRDAGDKVPASVGGEVDPARVFRDKVLDGWFQKLARMAYSGAEPVPEGMDRGVWQKAVYEVTRRLRDLAAAGGGTPGSDGTGG
jgi:hypothetical protein